MHNNPFHLWQQHRSAAHAAGECAEREIERKYIEVWVSERGTASKNRFWCRRLDQQILWTTEENAAVEMECGAAAAAAAIYIVTRKSVIAVPGSSIAWRNATFICTYFSLRSQIFLRARMCTKWNCKKITHLQVSNFSVERNALETTSVWLEIVLKIWPKCIAVYFFFNLYSSGVHYCDFRNAS